MARRLLAALFACFALVWATAAFAWEVPALTGRVVDTAGKLSPEDRQYLDDLIARENQSTGAQIAVLLAGPLDGENIETLANTYNTRHPDLNLKCFPWAELFLEKLYTSSEPTWRALFRLTTQNRHRIAADIRTHADGGKTVLLLESALSHTWNKNKNEYQFILGLQSLQRNIQTNFQNCKMAVIDVEAQKSKIGCSLFSLNFLLNAYQKDDLFNSLHERLNENGRCFEGHESAVIGGMEYIEGTKILPPIFYKHAQSRGTIDDFVKHQSHLQNTNVSTSQSGPRETLQERVQNFRVTRGERSYSMSIEASRMRKIRKAIEDL